MVFPHRVGMSRVERGRNVGLMNDSDGNEVPSPKFHIFHTWTAWRLANPGYSTMKVKTCQVCEKRKLKY